MSVPLQTQSPGLPGTLDEHIRGYGCKLSVGIAAVLAAWGDVDITPLAVYQMVRDCLASGKGILKDNDVPTSAPEDQWFRVEVQDMKAWIEYAGKWLGKPVSATRCITDRDGWKNGKWFKKDAYLIPKGCNFVEGEWDTDCLPGGLSHFTTLEALSGPVNIVFNPDPKIPIHDPKKALVSVRFWRIERA